MFFYEINRHQTGRRSFYKILDEGTAGTKQLVLTTVKDNQTTVQIDLYRSETDSMSDAEYVDTLRIKNLEPHPNGEPNLQLYVSIDDNGELHATVDDPETGKSSQIQNMIQLNNNNGMITMDQSLIALFRAGKIDEYTMLKYCIDQQEIRRLTGR